MTNEERKDIYKAINNVSKKVNDISQKLDEVIHMLNKETNSTHYVTVPACGLYLVDIKY